LNQEKKEAKVLKQEEKLARREDKLKRKEEKANKRDDRLERKEDRLRRKEEKVNKRDDRRGRKEDGGKFSSEKKEGEKLDEDDKQHQHHQHHQHQHKKGGRRCRENEGPVIHHNLDLTKESWPNRKRLYVDGNNMLYLTSSLRNATLRGNKVKAEHALEEATNAFVVGMAGTISHGILIFDHTSTHSVRTYPDLNGVDLIICSARPDFPTSDDALIQWCKDDSNIGIDSVFVTSDRALAIQLKELGGIIVKPRQFLVLAQAISGDKQEFEAWIEHLLNN